MTLRLSEAGKALLASTAVSMGISQSAVVELAIRQLARAWEEKGMNRSLADSLGDVQELLNNLDTLFEGVETDAEAQQAIAEASLPFVSLGQAGRILPMLSLDEKAQLLRITNSALSPTDKLGRLQDWFRQHGY